MKMTRKFKNKNLNKEGFTLLELIISSAILAILFGAMTAFGVQIIRGYNRVAALKETMENASFAVESINKTIRTSNTIDSDSDGEVFIIDNNTGRSYCYFFSGDKLRRKTGDNTAADCDDIGGATYDLVGTNDIKVSGSFKVKESDLSNGERGFVRTNVIIEYQASAQDNFSNDKIIIQSGVSLRDYGYNL